MRIDTKVRAVVINAKGQMLMMGARAHRVQQLPGGGVKPGENLDAAIIREVAEETGYSRVRIVKTSAPVLFRRSRSVIEVTVAYVVRVSKKTRRAMTRRERRRGLHVMRFDSLREALKALKARISRYGRSAARRDRKLIAALGLAKNSDLAALTA